MAAIDVDDIWAEMQQEQPWTSGKVSTKAINISMLQRERQRPKRAPAKQLDASLHWMQNWSASLTHASTVGVPAKAAPCPSLDGSGIGGMQMKEPPATLIDAVEEIPAETPETFLAYIQRDINCLGEDNLCVRQQSLLKLRRVLVEHSDNLSTDIVDAVLDALLKPLLKRLKDKSEKCRELSVIILRSLIENTSDLAATLAYVFPVLVARLGSEDLDGVAHLPEVMRPAPEQRPTEVARPVEESEEVRLQLARFVASLLTRCSQAQVISYIDEATGLLRAEAMDPFHEVKALACETMIAFCHNHSEMLLHFAEPLGRSLTSCLTHNHAKIRISGLRAITAVLWCGLWKHNHEIIQILMAWQDPNQCSIKAFYEPVTKLNYMSTLSFDRHPSVRRFWYETMAYWLLRIPDKVDHEPYLFPYLLTGLCDENEEIALEVFWLMERCGQAYEVEHETDLRKTKQYGFDHGWTYAGRAFVPFPLRALWAGGGLVEGSVRRTAARGPDMMGEMELREHHKRDTVLDVGEGGAVDGADFGEPLSLPVRDYAWPEFQDLVVYPKLPRPCLGSRSWVRTHTRRYIKATFNDVVDFRDCTALAAGRLLCMSLAYTEEGVTEWLQPMLAALCKFFCGRAVAAGDTDVMRIYNTICKLLGCFLDPASYWEQLKGSLDEDSSFSLAERIANVHILTLCIEGSVEALMSVNPPDPSLGMGRLEKVVPELISAMHSSDLLLAPSDESRRSMWSLVFSFLEQFCEYLSFAHVSQLLFVVLALAAKAPPEASAELAGSAAIEDAPEFEEDELLDANLLERALRTLTTRSNAASEGGEGALMFSLDSMDDMPAPEPTAAADPRVAHRRVFELAFTEVLGRLEDSFHVFRSVVYLTPVSVVTSAEHSDTVLERFACFCGSASSPSVRSSSQALGTHMASRCAKLLQAEPGSASAFRARDFMRNLLKVMSVAHMDMSASTESLSYVVTVAGISCLRRFLLRPYVDPRDALFASDRQEPSLPLHWLTSLMTDQELYKKLQLAMEHAETSHTGKVKKDFVIMRAKEIREESDKRTHIIRALAASTLILAIRRLLADGRDVPWPRNPQPGSTSAIFLGAASLFRTATPTMDPPFVKPTPASIVIYAAELLHLLLHRAPGGALPPFTLRDDAARAIHQLVMPASSPSLPLTLGAEERDTLTGDFIATLIGLNLTLPPDPQAKHAPTLLSDEPGGEVLIGWEEELASCRQTPHPDGGGEPCTKATRGSAVPQEVSRLLSQSLECQRWNAALALYVLGADLCVVCGDGFRRNLGTWRRRGEQAKILIAHDLLTRGQRAFDGG